MEFLMLFQVYARRHAAVVVSSGNAARMNVVNW